ncbi:MAG: 5-methylthioadenosine/S-adenosylhomocysteine deaminase [Myxococcota bacterium]|nr:5-methylthioadenosine/S-adenosylhomocysteine deaminase [Myxococcota bacterium]
MTTPDQRKQPKTTVDLVVDGATIVTMDPQNRVITHGAMAVDHGGILAIGPRDSILDSYTGKDWLSLDGDIVMPGLINCHTHIPMAVMRGVADDMALGKWLFEYVFPAENSLTLDRFQTGAEISLAEMIASGTTCFADMYYFQHELAHVVARAGVRAVLAASYKDLPSPDFPSADAALEGARRFIMDFHGHELITPALGPHSTYTLASEPLRKTAALAEETGALVLVHASETSGEVKMAMEKHGASPIEVLRRTGLLTPQSVLAHCVKVTQAEMETIAAAGASVAHCPDSNMKLASGIAPVTAMKRAGVRVVIGTDGPVSNNDQDMFAELRSAALVAKAADEDPEALPAMDVLRMATIEAARALHMDSRTGSLEPGKRADFIVVDIHRPHLQPFTNVFSHLAYSARGSDVSFTFVNGRRLYERGEFRTIDWERLEARAKTAWADLKKAIPVPWEKPPATPA